MEDYFKRKDLKSNSMLGWFKRSPSYYKMKITTDDEVKDNLSLERGSLIHLAALEPEKFVVANIEPVDGMAGKFIESKAAGDSDVVAHTKSGYKYTLEKALEIFNQPEKQAYYSFLMEANGKTVLSREDKRVIDKCLNSLRSHKAANQLLFAKDLFSSTEVEEYNELEIYWASPVTIDEDSEKRIIKCRSKIDRLLIDHGTKTIRIIDLKTTSKTAKGTLNFVEGEYVGTGFFSSFMYYSYYRQMAFYEDAVIQWLTTSPRNYNDYRIIVNMVIVETVGVYETAVYEIGDDLLQYGRSEYTKLLEDLLWHEESGSWDYDREYYEGTGIVNIY
jgi:hypothetical protein